MSSNPVTISLLEPFNLAWKKIKGTKLTFLLLSLTLIFFSIISKVTDPFGEVVTSHQLIWALVHYPLYIVKAISDFALIYFGVRSALGMPIAFGMIKDLFQRKTLFKLIGVWLLSLGIVLLPILIFGIVPALLTLNQQAHVVVSDSTIQVTQHIEHVMKFLTAGLYLIGIIVGLYLSMRLLFSFPLVMMQNMKPWQAIKLSFKVTKSRAFKLFSILLVSLLIIMLGGFVTLGIGLFWFIPFIAIVQGELYKRFIVENSIAQQVQ